MYFLHLQLLFDLYLFLTTYHKIQKHYCIILQASHIQTLVNIFWTNGSTLNSTQLNSTKWRVIMICPPPKKSPRPPENFKNNFFSPNLIPPNSTQFNPIQLNSTQFNPMQPKSTQVNPSQPKSTQFNQIQPNSTKFISNKIRVDH